MPVTEMFYNTFYFWLIVLLATPVITMRLFALEKATGTFETLMTTPVGDLQVVAAKFTAAMIFYVVMWLPLLACLFIVRHFTNQASALDCGHGRRNVSGNFSDRLHCFLSLGCFASALTRSQMAAAMISFVVRRQLVFARLIWPKAMPASPTSGSRSCCRISTCSTRWSDFARGVVDTRAVIFYVSATFLFLFLTLRVVESRRWK